MQSRSAQAPRHRIAEIRAVQYRLQREVGEVPIIATAGWSVPKTVSTRFPPDGSGLSRYAAVFSGVEINSTFYRRHKSSTFERWANAVGDKFRFAVKMPREITHDLRLKNVEEPFAVFLDDIAPLAGKLGPLLCQLPPSLRFDDDVVGAALDSMRAAYSGTMVLEARHHSWAAAPALALLETYSIERVFADPAPVWQLKDFKDPPLYLRLHGAPKIYYSSYSDAEIAEFFASMSAHSWCVFDNTASGAAIVNALAMLDLISKQ